MYDIVILYLLNSFPYLGIPQGLNTGPLLFVKSVNDVIRVAHYEKLVFVDD